MTPHCRLRSVQTGGFDCGPAALQAEELRGLAEDGTDPALASLARGELETLVTGLPDLQRRLLLRLLPRDEADDRSAVLEVRQAWTALPAPPIGTFGV